MRELSPTQHCTIEDEDHYTFSHTAQWCGREQPRPCGCAFCYPDGYWDGPEEKEVHIIQDGDRHIAGVYYDQNEAERELYRLNNLTTEAKRLASYGKHDWYEIRTFDVE
jgi:hypothetical protein